MAWIEPLDLESLLVDKLAGSMILFTFLAIIVLAMLAARWRMPNIVFGGMIMMFIVFIGLGSTLGLGSPIGGLLLIGLILMGIAIAEIIKRWGGQ